MNAEEKIPDVSIDRVIQDLEWELRGCEKNSSVMIPTWKLVRLLQFAKRTTNTKQTNNTGDAT